MDTHAQLVIGPRAAGRSTFCRLIQEHCDATKHTVHIVNLDPATEHFGYRPTLDIRDLVGGRRDGGAAAAGATGSGVWSALDAAASA